MSLYKNTGDGEDEVRDVVIDGRDVERVYLNLGDGRGEVLVWERSSELVSHYDAREMQSQPRVQYDARDP